MLFEYHLLEFNRGENGRILTNEIFSFQIALEILFNNMTHGPKCESIHADIFFPFHPQSKPTDVKDGG